MKSILTVIVASLLFVSCNKEKQCAETEQRTDGNILTISGPDSLTIGKTIPLLIEVEVNDSFCVKKVEGVIVNNIGNHVQLGAKLVHTGYQKDNDCGCTDAETLYTVIYFTPNVAGSYVFDSKPPSPIINLGDSSGHEIIVH
jgi:hypothetical protein